MLQRFLVPSFFIHSFFYLSILPLLYWAYLHMNDQFKFVQTHSSKYVWGVCGYAQVWAGVCMGIHEYVWVCPVPLCKARHIGSWLLIISNQIMIMYLTLPEYALVCVGVLWCAQVCVGVFRCISMGMHACAQICTSVCGMNFQNTYWKLES